MVKLIEAIEEFVVVAHRVNLSLNMTQLIDRLHLCCNARANATHLTTSEGKA